MIKYGDYFSRKTLYTCGISPDRFLQIKSDAVYSEGDRTTEIATDIKNVYQTFVTALEKKQVKSPVQEAQNLAVYKKIVNAFYDSGVLSNKERDYFYQNDLTLNNNAPLNTRESIVVSEADFSLSGEKTGKKVQAQIQQPTTKKVR